MPAEYQLPIVFSMLFSSITAGAFAVLLLGKKYYRRQYARRLSIREELNGCLASGSLPVLPEKDFLTFLHEYGRLTDEVVIPANLSAFLRLEIERRGYKRLWLRQLRRGILAARMEAATLLSLCAGDDLVSELIAAFQAERSSMVRFQIAHSFVRLEAVEAIPHVVETLRTGPEWYQYRLIEILLLFGLEFGKYIESELDAGRKEALPLAVAFSRRFMRVKILDHVEAEALSGERYAVQAARVLAERFPDRLNKEEFRSHPNPHVRGRAWEALARFPNAENLMKTVEAAGDPSMTQYAVRAIADIVRKAPSSLPALMSRFESELAGPDAADNVRLDALAAVLAARIDYFIYGARNVDRLIGYSIKRQKVAALAAFLRSNRNAEIEEAVIRRIGALAGENDRPVLAANMDKRTLEKLGIPPPPPIPRRSPLKIGAGEKAFLWIIALLSIFAAPSVFFFFHSVPGEGLTDALRRYTVGYGSAFAYYSLAVNGIYLALLSLSVVQLIKQLGIWSSSRTSFLTTERMMSPVSVIVPAFREEASIVENIRSLLSLNYPQFEVIVVCDGSPDGTLERVTESYDMEKVDSDLTMLLPSAPVRGIYKSGSYPFLTVVDKVNGGKADALNAGINFAKHDHICCVDADSLLESDALTKLMYQIIAEEKEVVACGGNIIPINDCEVRMGSIRKYRPPKSTIARFQTVEYLRAFLAGRLGWAYADSLLIISGAFGVFKRSRVLEIGGYLTGEGAGKFDTVGEDMELVVRLSRHMREKKLPFKVAYAFNANCWTQVPEDLASLRRQRDRWHRGLIEILLYHRRCAFNPRYGRMGLVGIPYFIIFELIGPFFELFGWITVPLAAVLGVLNGPLAMLLLATTVLFGVSISTTSLAISEFQVMYYSPKDTAKLLAFSVLENFGYRQWMSASRVFAFIGTLFGRSGWGAMKRRGFSKKK